MTEARRHRPVIAAFRRTYRQMVSELIDRLDAAGFRGLTAASHVVFEDIDPDGTRVTELAARADMTRQSMSELVAVLERRGWVRRDQDPVDLRAQIVRLTPEGRRLVLAALQAMTEIENEWQMRWRRAGCRNNLGTILEAALTGSAPVRKNATASPRSAAKARLRKSGISLRGGHG